MVLHFIQQIDMLNILTKGLDKLGDLMKIPKWNPDSCNPTVLKVSKIICLYFEKNMKKSHPYVSLIENYRCIFFKYL
jgi:hypothetical protein